MPNRTYRKLTPQQRQQIWAMRYLEHRRQLDIAKELNVGQGTVSRTCSDPRRVAWIKEQERQAEVSIA